MKLYETVPPGRKPLWYMGRAWIQWERIDGPSLCILLPFNWLAAWIRTGWWWLRKGPKSLEGNAWSEGYQQGAKDTQMRKCNPSIVVEDLRPFELTPMELEFIEVLGISEERLIAALSGVIQT